VIVDLERFVVEERPTWSALQEQLERLERDPARRLGLDEIRRLHYLYERTSADLARIATFSAAPGVRRYLESLVGRTYAEIHDPRARAAGAAQRAAGGVSRVGRALRAFPEAVRRNAAALVLAAAVTAAGSLFGAAAVGVDRDAREILIPFTALHHSPAQRVAREEAQQEDPLRGGRASFSAYLMTHNVRVSILLLALGMTWGVGTVALLFYNGALLGAVAADYVLEGQAKFLLGWLLPHGAIEIPAFVIAGQAGLLLAGALIGVGGREALSRRLRLVGRDVLTLGLGVAGMLVWAGFVEAFLSQYHEPVLPYALKIGFGVLELGALAAYLFSRWHRRTP
jgi:uncharacterized membrane protein SpoIIM required for sporulation